MSKKTQIVDIETRIEKLEKQVKELKDTNIKIENKKLTEDVVKIVIEKINTDLQRKGVIQTTNKTKNKK
jgi:hypothetical protein